MPIRIQLSRRKGWRMPPGTVKVDRSTRWGNPFHGDGPFDRTYVVQCFRDHIWRPEQVELRAAIRGELAGKDLACWCPTDQPCHADVLLEIANAQPSPNGQEPSE
jgi:hypothetical protein